MKKLIFIFICLVTISVNAEEHNSRMNCLDCHTVPAHVIYVDYKELVDENVIPLKYPIESSEVLLYDGLITCLTCHDVEGVNKNLLTTPTNNELCVFCHDE